MRLIHLRGGGVGGGEIKDKRQTLFFITIKSSIKAFMSSKGSICGRLRQVKVEMMGLF